MPKAPPTAHTVTRQRVIRESSLYGLLKRSARQMAIHGRRRLRGGPVSPYHYRLSSMLNMYYRSWRDIRRLTRGSTVRLADLDGRRFVYFPLHVEPERALQNISPEFFFQHAAIAALSRDLPADAVLAVKEHIPAIGRRPDHFYEQLAELPNVVLINPVELGFECVGRSAAVATITGSAGQEAAVLGKPVVLFGRHVWYRFLPHVHSVQGLDDLRPVLASALDSAQDEAANRAAGERYLQALLAAACDVGDYDFRRPTRVDDAMIESLYAGLMADLSLEEPAAVARAAEA